MNIFKKLFSKKRNVKEEVQECWYNNTQDSANGTSNIPFDAAGSENAYEGALTNSLVRK